MSNAIPAAARPESTACPPLRARRSRAAAHRLLALLAAAAGHPALCLWLGPGTFWHLHRHGGARR